MDIIKLVVIFATLLLIINGKLKLYFAVFAASLVAIVLFRLPLLSSLVGMGKALVDSLCMNAILTFYLLSVLQVMMEGEGLYERAKHALKIVSRRNRLNVLIAPAILGMLPTANAVLISAPFVEDGCKDKVDNLNKAFVTTFVRHIPESALHTFPSVILALALTGLPAGAFVLHMVPIMLTTAILTYIFVLRKIDKFTDVDPATAGQKAAWKEIFSGLWSFIVLMLLISLTPLGVPLSSAVTLGLFCLVRRLPLKEILFYLKKGFFFHLILSTASVYAFAQVISDTGLLTRLPEIFSTLPIPLFLLFAIVTFLGTLVANIQAVTAIVLPVAFSTIAGAGIPLLVLLMGVGYAAMQVTPAHVCLTIISDYFDIKVSDLIRRSLAPTALLTMVTVCYYMLLVYVF